MEKRQPRANILLARILTNYRSVEEKIAAVRELCSDPAANSARLRRVLASREPEVRRAATAALGDRSTKILVLGVETVEVPHEEVRHERGI